VSAPDELELSDLPARLMHPPRRRLQDVASAVAGTLTGSDAWQRLVERGAVPAELAASPDRRFAVVDTGWAFPPINAAGIDLRAAPATVDAAVAIAADADGVLETEGWARTLRTRLLPWGALPPTEIDWIVYTHLVPFNHELGPVLTAVKHSTEYALEEIGVAMKTLGPQPPWLPPLVGELIAAWHGWQVASAEALTVPGAFDVPRALVGTSFDTLDDPFAPALEILVRGYTLDHHCHDNAPEIRIYTTVVDAPQNLRQALRDQARARKG
jgi:hypothetical protein